VQPWKSSLSPFAPFAPQELTAKVPEAGMCLGKGNMKTTANNPKSNKLPAGIEDENLVKAILSSGYPLQGVVARKLSKQFTITEEWGFIDRDSQDHRSLDVVAYKPLYNDSCNSIHPGLFLLIECKRTNHPFIFFRNVTEKSIPGFPSISGLINRRVSIHNQAGNSSTEAHGCDALGLGEHDFIKTMPPRCSAFSKAVPSGKRVELSGTDPFNSIVLPLVKAIDHAFQLQKVDSRPARLFPILLLCITVLDAPIVLVESPELASEPVLAPWVRIVRQEASQGTQRLEPYRYYAIDAVHIDFFDEFINNHLMPFAEEYGRRAIAFEDILMNGGEVPNISNWQWNDIKPSTKAKAAV